MVRWINEKSSNVRATKSMNIFNCLIGEMDLVDIPFQNGFFSWSEFRVRSVRSKLEKFLRSKPWVDYFREVSGEIFACTTFDHFLILLKLRMQS